MLFVYFSLYNISFHWVSLGAGQVRLDSDRGLEMAVSSCGMVRAQLDQQLRVAGASWGQGGDRLQCIFRQSRLHSINYNTQNTNNTALNRLQNQVSGQGLLNLCPGP